jgi:hypothetical protein
MALPVAVASTISIAAPLMPADVIDSALALLADGRDGWAEAALIAWSD